jgi:peptidoglycan LD-endopeptidase CwlK
MTPTERLKGCKPALVRKVGAIIRDLAGHGIHAVVVDGKRSQARQDELYAQGRTTPGKVVTQVRHSKHTEGKAADIWFVVNGKTTCEVPARYWDLLGSSARAHNLTWGGDWKWRDRPHVELKED